MDGLTTTIALAWRSLSVARASSPLAVVYGFGAYWIVSGLAIGILVTAAFFVRPPVSALYLPTAALAASAAAVAVALRSGGWVSVGGLVLAAAAYVLVFECDFAATVFGTCALEIVRGHVGEAIGALLGLPLARGVRSRDGRSALLLVAGILAIAAPILIVSFELLDDVTGAAAYERYLWVVGVQAGAAIAGGVLLGWTARRSLRALLTVGVVILLPWLGGTFRRWWQDRQDLLEHGFSLNLATIVQTEWRSFLPLAYFALLAIAFGVARAGRALLPIAHGQRLPRTDP